MPLLLFSQQVMSSSLWPHGLQHARLPCPSLSPRVCSNSCPLNWRCHPTILSCHPLLFLPSIFHSISVFSNELALHSRYQHIGASASVLTTGYSGLISFRIDWFNLLAVQGTLKSLLQDCNSKASILRCSAFFMAQLSHSYMTTGKATTLNVTSLLFNILPRFVTEQLTPWKSACILDRAECLPLLFPRERFLLYIWV